MDFLDVDFTKDPNYVRGDLGLGDIGGLCGSYEDAYEVFDYDRIDQEIEKLDATGGGAEQLVTRIFNQGQEGSCVSQAFAQADEVLQALQHGRDRVVHLSAISLYKRIGRSPGSGAMVSDGIKELVSRGILPLDNAENRAKYGNHVMPNTGFYTPFPSGWELTAAKFKGHEYYICRSPQAVFTALCKHIPVVVGRAGHSICYIRPTKRSGRRVIKYVNSWGNWGDNGYGYDSAGMIADASGWAVAVMSTVNSRKAA